MIKNKPIDWCDVKWKNAKLEAYLGIESSLLLTWHVFFALDTNFYLCLLAVYFKTKTQYSVYYLYNYWRIQSPGGGGLLRNEGNLLPGIQLV